MNDNLKLKDRRIELGLTMDEVAEIVGVSKSTVSKWESGHIENMKRDKISLLAKALNVSPLYIMGLDDSHFESDSSINQKNTSMPSPHSSYFAKKKVLADIKNNEANTYTIHGSQGKGTVIKSTGSKDKGVLAFNEKTYELTKAEFTALESVIKAMRNEIRE